MTLPRIRSFRADTRVRVANPQHPQFNCVGYVTKPGRYASEVELTHKGRTRRQNFLNTSLISEPERLAPETLSKGTGVFIQDSLSPYFLRPGVVYAVSGDLCLVSFGEFFTDDDGNLHCKYRQFHLDDIALITGRSRGTCKGRGSLRG